MVTQREMQIDWLIIVKTKVISFLYSKYVAGGVILP